MSRTLFTNIPTSSTPQNVVEMFLRNLPIVSYRRSNNLSHILVRVQLPETDNCNNARTTPGSFRCNSRNCTTCAYIDHARSWNYTFYSAGEPYKIKSHFQCYLHDSMPPFYKICNILGKPNAASRTVFRYRRPILYPSGSYIQTAVSEHFLSNSHSVSHMLLIPSIETLRYERDCLRKASEAHLTHKAKTIEPLGMNKRDEL